MRMKMIELFYAIYIYVKIFFKEQLIVVWLDMFYEENTLL